MASSSTGPCADSAVMQAPGGCNCACPFTLTVLACSSSAGGMTVDARATSGGAIVATGVTDPSGKVTLALPSAGTYFFTASGNAAFNAATTSLSVTCGGSGTFNIGSSAMKAGWCCGPGCTGGNVAFPTALYLTDAIGTIPITLLNCGSAISGRNLSIDVITCPQTSSGLPCTVGPGVTRITYFVDVLAGGLLNVQRLWTPALCSTTAGGPAGTFYDNSAPPPGSQVCAHFGSGGDNSQLRSPFSGCGGFFWSGTLVPLSTNKLPDPIGGTVVISS